MSRRAGFLHWVFPAMLAAVGLASLLSGRDLSQAFLELQAGDNIQAGGIVLHPAAIWAQRAVSLILLLAAGERIASHLAGHKPMPSPVLTVAFVAYWLTTVAACALFGTHRQVSHEYLYPLVLGCAGLLVTVTEGDRILDASRTALFVFMLLGVLLIPVLPNAVMDVSYKQGLIPGLPRLGGLAPHSVALGLLAETALMLLWCRPFSRRWLNRACWILGLGVLFMAQSKTAWIAFLLCSITMLAVRQGPSMWRRLGDPREGAFGAVVCLGAIVFAAGLLAVLVFGDLEGQLSSLSDSAQGAQLISMTGRDQIWAVAMEEWQANRLFGYGPGLWDSEYRASIGMPHATSAHNQFMDTLARSGTVGAVGLVIYACVLLVMSLRYARATGGLSLALFLALALLSVSEVPLMLFTYGTESFTHLLLVITLASAASARVPAAQARPRPVYRPAA